MTKLIIIATLAMLTALCLYHEHKRRENMRKPTLRELCRREYGDEFAEGYDMLCGGCVIGGFAETIALIDMVEAVKEKYRGQWRNG